MQQAIGNGCYLGGLNSGYCKRNHESTRMLQESSIQLFILFQSWLQAWAWRGIPKKSTLQAIPWCFPTRCTVVCFKILDSKNFNSSLKENRLSASTRKCLISLTLLRNRTLIYAKTLYRRYPTRSMAEFPNSVIISNATSNGALIDLHTNKLNYPYKNSLNKK